jgi:3-methyladenine DNA glycosylase AlkD
MREDLTEDKLAGILLVQEVLLTEGVIDWRGDLPVLASMFDDGHIYDWNTCDWLCVRVLGPLAEREREACARAIAEWRSTANLWRRRASGVAFVNHAGADRELFVGFRAMVLEICWPTVRDPQRFAQTGTGWVLRELSKADPSLVIGFVEAHLGLMSREAVRSTTAKLPQEDTARLLAVHKRGRTENRDSRIEKE